MSECGFLFAVVYHGGGNRSMIAFFPEVYPDELVYSWLARYGVRSGYTHYRAIADDLFTSHTAKPNLEFVIELSQDAYEVITDAMPFESVIMQHTMFPYYARFLPIERRQKAFGQLMNMSKSFNDTLYIRRNKTQHRPWLRYCPLCAESDRMQYGEAYWHRLHQLDHIDICPVHGCHLLNSTVSSTSKESPSLTHAELEIPQALLPVFSQNPLERQVAAYVSEVFSADLAIENAVTIGSFMHHKLEYTKYLSPRGQKRNLALLTDDFNDFYQTLPHPTLAEHWQLEKIFSNYRCHTYDICLLALFLGVPVTELVDMKLPEKTQAQLFDEEIIWLHNNGLNYRQISQKMGASYDYCKLAAKRYRTAH